MNKKYSIIKIVLIIITSIIFLSCDEPSDDSHCYLKYRNGEKIYMDLDSNKIEVIINYKIHALNHDSTMSNIPCRYRVSWTNDNGGNENSLIYNDKQLHKTKG